MKVYLLRMTAALAVWSMIIVVPASAQAGHDAGEKKLFTKHFSKSLFDITKNASYSIEILLDDKEYHIGKDTYGMIVHNDKDADVGGADLSLTLKNLDTGKPAPDAPAITYRGDGLYIIKGLDLKREGRWELTVNVSKDGHEDRAVFVFPDVLKNRYKKGRYSP
jgi:hypothetical protein